MLPTTHNLGPRETRVNVRLQSLGKPWGAANALDVVLVLLKNYVLDSGKVDGVTG